MYPKINVITLAVSDLERSLEFYRGLGFSSKGIIADDLHDPRTGASGRVAFFELADSLMLALYERGNLAKDAGIEAGVANSNEFSIGYFARSQEEVNTLLLQAKKHGAAVTDPGHERPWGIYSAYFLDLDGHMWEIIWNPHV
jgi:hypothetical protein